MKLIYFDYIFSPLFFKLNLYIEHERIRLGITLRLDDSFIIAYGMY